MNSGQAVNNYLCANHEPGDPTLHEGNRLAHEVARLSVEWRRADGRYWEVDEDGEADALASLRQIEEEWETAVVAYEKAVSACKSGGAGEGGE